MSGRLYYWVANWDLSRAEAAARLGNHVVDMVDCTHDALPRVRDCFGVIHIVGGYITGTPDIRWSALDFNSLPSSVTPLSIDQSNLDLPLLANVKKVVKDVESGASTIAQAVHVAHERIVGHGEDYTIYCSQSDLSALEGAARKAGLPNGEIVAYQWASPTSNPNTQLPGTRYTLREANADLTVMRADFAAQLGSHPPAKQPPTAHPVASRHKLARAHVTGHGDIQLDLHSLTWRSLSPGVTVTPLPWGD